LGGESVREISSGEQWWDREGRTFLCVRRTCKKGQIVGLMG